MYVEKVQKNYLSKEVSNLLYANYFVLDKNQEMPHEN